MEMNKKLLTVAVSSALLAACGGSSSSGDRAPYALTEADALPAGKAFVAKFDETVTAAAAEIAPFAVDVAEAIAVIETDNDGNQYVGELKSGIYHLMTMLDETSYIAERLRCEAEYKQRWGEYSADLVLGEIYTDSEDWESCEYAPGGMAFPYRGYNTGVSYQFTENAETGELEVVIVHGLTDQNQSTTRGTVNMAFNRVSAVESNIIVSADISNQDQGIDIAIEGATFNTNSVLTGPTLSMDIASVTANMGDLTVTGSANVALVAGAPSAERGTAGMIPYVDYVTGYMKNFSGLGYQTDNVLNIASIEIADLKVENDLGQYVALNAMYEDADAADFEGSYGGYAGVVDYAFSEDLNTLVLSDDYGQTTYTYVERPEPEPESAPLMISEAPAEPAMDGFILCEVEDLSAELSAPEFYDINCNDDGEISLGGSTYENLQQALISRNYEDYLRYQASSRQYIPYDRRFRHNQSVLEGQIEIQRDYHRGLDDIVEPVTFSVSVSGEFGQADGNVIPFSGTLNHSNAYIYDWDATIGSEGNAITYDDSTDKSITLISGTVAYTGDENQPAGDVAVVFEIDKGATWPEEGDKVVGELKVEGTVVAYLKQVASQPGNASNEQYVEFTDGTFPADGGVFTTIEDAYPRECGDNETAPCYTAQAGVISMENVEDAFCSAGMPALRGPEICMPEPVVEED